jgi:hypothetical protein
VHWEDSLYAAAVGNTANGEGRVDAAFFDADNGTFKSLQSFLVALFDFNLYANGVTYFERWQLVLHAGLGNFL